MLRTLLGLIMAACLGWGCATQEEPAPAPEKTDTHAPARPEVEPLKAKVAALTGRVRRVDPRQAAALTPLLSERAAALASLMDVDAGAALALALPEPVRGRLAGKLPGAATHLEEHGAFEGELEVLVVDGPALTELRTDYFVHVKGERLQVRFTGDAPPGLRSGQRLRVRGLKLGGRVAAREAEVVPEVTALSGTAPCSATGDQRSIVILATFPGQPQTLTEAEVNEAFFSSTQRSLTRFWSEASQGRTTASGDVVGWYTLDRAYSCNESDALRLAAIAAADADVDFSQYDRIFIVHPAAAGTGCYYAGLGSLACYTHTTQDGPVTASVSWLRAEYLTPNDTAVELITHEGGHNLSLHHASSRDFGAEALGPPGTRGTLAEYGDWFSTMGSWNLGHYAAPHKARLGWLEPGAVATVDGTGGTFTLSPFSGPVGSGLQALRVRRGFHGDGWLWLEARRPVGDYDSTLPSQPFGGALVHYEEPNTSSYTHLLDFTTDTSSFWDPAFLPGTWTDPYTNLRVTVESATPEGVTVSVHYEPVPCVRAPPTVELESWYEYAVPGWEVESGLTLINNDTLGCPASTFALQSALPSGWPTLQLPATVTVEPGKRRDVYFYKQVPESTAYGTYTLDATVTRDGEAVTKTDTLEVVPPCQTAPIQVSHTPSQTVSPGGTVAIYAEVTSQDTRACGWVYYEPASSMPEGWETFFEPYGFDIPAGGNRSFVMYKSVPVDAQEGTYTVDLQLLRDGVTVETTVTATVDVVEEEDLCVRAGPSFTALPAIVDVEPGGSVTYTLTLTNHDSAECASSTFDLAHSGPDGWARGLSAPSLTVMPGATATALLTVTAPATATAGPRWFEVAVTRDGQYVHGAELEARVICRRSAPQVAFSPAVGSVEAGQPRAFTMTVTNTDNAACEEGSFLVGTTVPSGWTYSFSQASLTLAPGASGSVGLTVTPLETATPGRYNLSALASHTGADPGTGGFAVDVTEPPLQATLSVLAGSYKRNSLVPLTSTVTQGTRSAQASVRFSVLRPDGLTETLTVSTDASGKATWSYTARVRGTHRVTATATSGTQTATTSTVSFSVL
ncbi:MAG TPA: NEW3 domain-containing protein [Myxococcus sp.]|nr:NEW3 domain-containing protein [Myxococcus sp.]